MTKPPNQHLRVNQRHHQIMLDQVSRHIFSSQWIQNRHSSLQKDRCKLLPSIRTRDQISVQATKQGQRPTRQRPCGGYSREHKQISAIFKENGGAERDRTADPLLAKQVLSQLSYSPNSMRSRAKRSTGARNDARRPLALRKPKLSNSKQTRSSKSTVTHQTGAKHHAGRPARPAQRWFKEPSSVSRNKWWAREDLNFRPHAYQACALTN